jgi:hypothetical protein
MSLARQLKRISDGEDVGARRKAAFQTMLVKNFGDNDNDDSDVGYGSAGSEEERPEKKERKKKTNVRRRMESEEEPDIDDEREDEGKVHEKVKNEGKDVEEEEAEEEEEEEEEEDIQEKKEEMVVGERADRLERKKKNKQGETVLVKKRKVTAKKKRSIYRFLFYAENEKWICRFKNQCGEDGVHNSFKSSNMERHFKSHHPKKLEAGPHARCYVLVCCGSLLNVIRMLLAIPAGESMCETDFSNR